MTKRVAKKKLSDITFTHEGAHVALVTKQQEGPANGHAYTLVMKSNFSKEAIQKMQQVRVTLELPEFLERFFNLYGTDAKVLACMMGYVEPEETEEYSDDWYENRIKERLASYEILKSMKDAKDFTEVLASLAEEEYISLLEDQSQIEKSLKFEKIPDTEKETEVKPEIKKSKVKPSKSTNAVDTEKTVVTVKGNKNMDEVVELQKALDANKVELQKALDTLAALNAERVAQNKAKRLETLKAAVKDEARATVLFKSLDLIEGEEEFNAVVSELSAMTALVEKSALFEEKGSQVEVETSPVKESAIAKALKAEIAKAAGNSK